MLAGVWVARMDVWWSCSALQCAMRCHHPIKYLKTMMDVQRKCKRRLLFRAGREVKSKTTSSDAVTTM